MPTDFEGADAPNADEIDALAIPRKVDVVVGSTATLLTKPDGKSLLVMKCTLGSFLIETGDNVSAFPADAVATTVTAGVGTGAASWPITPLDLTLRISAPDTVTVKGADGTSKLYFYWL